MSKFFQSKALRGVLTILVAAALVRLARQLRAWGKSDDNNSSNGALK